MSTSPFRLALITLLSCLPYCLLFYCYLVEAMQLSVLLLVLSEFSFVFSAQSIMSLPNLQNSPINSQTFLTISISRFNY